MAQKGVIGPNDVPRLLRQQPFKPFRVRMSDGNQFDIGQPELVWVFKNRICVAVPHEQREGWLQDMHYCAMLHITCLEELADAG